MLTIIGEALVDIIHGADPDVDAPAAFPGGSPLNVAVGCSRLGMDARLVTAYGNDEYGRMIGGYLAANAVAAVNGGLDVTSTATAHLDERGAATYEFDIRWDIAGALADAEITLGDTHHTHTGSIATALLPGGDAVLGLIAEAHPHSTISFDPNCRPAISPDVADARTRAEAFVALSDIVKASDEDLEWLYPHRTLDESAAAWLKLGPAMVIVTRGADGPVVWSSGIRIEVPAPEVDVADTVGAGDSFMSGLLSGLDAADLLGPAARPRLRSLSEDTLHNLAAYANRTAAITCSRAGSNPPWQAELAITAPLPIPPTPAWSLQDPPRTAPGAVISPPVPAPSGRAGSAPQAPR
jgi:fructokinase